MRSYEFYIKPGTGEQAEAAIPLPQSQGAVIAGRVTDGQGPVEGALVLLLDQEADTLLHYTVSDHLGRFWFGPLDEEKLYLLRVQKLDSPVRTVELT